jgi:5'-deoxynucleotidase YfbR-like HD superfamily hydrolase
MKNAKPTFNEILKNTAKENAEKLMAKARLANNLAKRFKGKNRQNAYLVKADALCGLVKSLPNKVNVCKDIRLTEFVVIELKTAQSGLHLPIAKLQGI